MGFLLRAIGNKVDLNLNRTMVFHANTSEFKPAYSKLRTLMMILFWFLRDFIPLS